MKKTIFAVVLAIMLAAVPVMADTSSVSGGIDTYKSDYSASYHGWGNDSASASAGSMGEFKATSKGIFSSYATGQAGSTSCANTFAADFGQTSIAGAESSTNSFATSYAKKLSYNEVSVQGGASQGNSANEVGYNGANAAGGNYTDASYKGTCYNGSLGWGSSADIYGNASAQGMTFVTVDPTGSQRSAFGVTMGSSQANLNGSGFCPGCQNTTTVSGNGQMGTDAHITTHSGSANAGNNASFSYVGNNSGSGFATGYSVVNAGRCGSNCISAYSTSTAGTRSGAQQPR